VANPHLLAILALNQKESDQVLRIHCDPLFLIKNQACLKAGDYSSYLCEASIFISVFEVK
jgi:hypothetical protein